jgi:hypothetical protein
MFIGLQKFVAISQHLHSENRVFAGF